MADGNLIYGNQPVTPPGLSAIPYMVGGYIAPYVGGYMHPYVPQNQSTFGVSAAMANDAAYKAMLSSAYGQMFSQAAATAGALPVVQSFGGMVGYSPAQIQRDLASGGGTFGRSAIGSLLAPLADQGLTAAGLSGGSFLSAVSGAFNNRFNMLSAGIMVNPTDLKMQSQAIGGANAFAQMINGLYSQWDAKAGTATLSPDLEYTRGLSREAVTHVAMAMLNRGAFNRDIVGPNGSVFSAGLTDQLQAAVGRTDLNTLDWSAGDFLNKGGTESGARLARLTKEVSRKLDGGIKAVAAFRDMFNDVDDAISKLETLTNGEWARSGSDAFMAAKAGRRLHAVTQMYNLDPTDAANSIMSMRGVMQDAAYFGADMQAYGFTGGGMFGLAAQTEVLANVEDIITRRGVRGDPVRSKRIRMQAAQQLAQSMNTRGGVGAQLLAWGHQNGVISDADADVFAAELSSGDRGVMGDSLNRLLTRLFGSAARGEKMMSDATFIQAMRESLTDQSGAMANRLMMTGANREFSRRELLTAADNRLVASVDAMRTMGLGTIQSDESLAAAIGDMAADLRNDPELGAGGNDVANYVTATYRKHLANGNSAHSAYRLVLKDLKDTPTLAKYYERASMAAKNSLAGFNERRIADEGLPSITAKLLTESLRRSGTIDGAQAYEVLELSRTGKSEEALSKAEGYLAGASPEVRKIAEQQRGEAQRIYDRSLEAAAARDDATTMLRVARDGGFTASDVVESINTVANAARTYDGSKARGEDYFRDLVQKAGFNEKFGDAMYRGLMEALRKGPEALHAFGSRLGRAAVPLQENAIATLAATGSGYNMTGYFGGGLSSVNSGAAAAQRERLVSAVAGSLAESEFKDADDRTTFSNKLVDFFTGHRDWKGLLNIYDPTGKTGSAFRQYGEAATDYWSAVDEMRGYRDGLTGIVNDLEKDGKYDSAKQLRQMLNDGTLSEASVGDFLEKKDVASSVTGKQRELLKSAAGAQKKLRDARQRSEDILQKTLGDKKNVALAKGLVSREDYEKRRREEYGTDQYAGAVDAISKIGKDAFDKLVADTGLNVSVDEIAAKLNTTSENVAIYAPEQIKKAVAQIARGQSVNGVAGAMAFMDKAKAYADAEKNKIHGELIIKDGNESRPGVLEAVLGGGIGR